MNRPLSYILSVALLIPGFVLALDYSGTHLPYSDVRAGTPEAAGINLLTAEGVLEGYSDGTFRPNQTLNRAEFLKIVLESHPDTVVVDSDAANCFPDVRSADWFAQYVCYAKANSIVGGYPDGNFKPANTVNYAEALKILGELYGYTLPEPPANERWTWYRPYILAADEHGVLLPINLDPAALLTRGQMARLAAGFLAESEGELEMYRNAERGKPVSSASISVSSVSSSSSSSSSVSSSSSSASSVSSALFTLPAVDHFLVVGQVSDAIANVTLPAQSEETDLRSVKITLFNEAASIDRLEIVTVSGTLIASLKQRTTADQANYKRIYEVNNDSGTGFVLPANTALPIVVRARIRGFDNNGASEQFVRIQAFTLRMYGKQSGTTYELAFPPPFPAHQTAFGRITRVMRVGPSTAPLTEGTGALLGSFSFSGVMIPAQSITIKSLIFTPTISSNVEVHNWRLTSPGSGINAPCSRGIDGISCSVIPASIGSITATPRVLELRGDVDIFGNVTDALVQVSLVTPGSTSELGSVQWTDGSSTFTWIEAKAPVATGTAFQQ